MIQENSFILKLLEDMRMSIVEHIRIRILIRNWDLK